MAVSAVTNSSAENAQRACYLPIPPKNKQKMRAMGSIACKTTSQSCPADLPETITVTRQLAAAGDISDRHRLRAHEAVIRNRYGGRDGILDDLKMRLAVFPSAAPKVRH